jgi:hypothetical protein
MVAEGKVYSVGRVSKKMLLRCVDISIRSDQGKAQPKCICYQSEEVRNKAEGVAMELCWAFSTTARLDIGIHFWRR